MKFHIEYLPIYLLACKFEIVAFECGSFSLFSYAGYIYTSDTPEEKLRLCFTRYSLCPSISVCQTTVRQSSQFQSDINNLWMEILHFPCRSNSIYLGTLCGDIIDIIAVFLLRNGNCFC